MIRIHDFGRWQAVKPDDSLHLPGEGLRTVKISFNTSDLIRVFASFGDHPPMFLCKVDGLQHVEFTADGDVEVKFLGKGNIWYFTNDGQDMTVPKSEDAYSFTKIATRRQRNYEMEYVMWTMAQNQERMLRHLESEYLARIEALSEDEYDRETGEQGRARASTGKGRAGGSAASRSRVPADGSSDGDPEGEGGDGSGGNPPQSAGASPRGSGSK